MFWYQSVWQIFPELEGWLKTSWEWKQIPNVSQPIIGIMFLPQKKPQSIFPFFAQSIYRSTFLFRNILHIPTGFDTLDILNLFFTFQKNSLYSNKIALGVVLTYLNLSQIFKLKLGSWISFEVLTRKFKATFYSFKRNKK